MAARRAAGRRERTLKGWWHAAARQRNLRFAEADETA
jgi:hypothetical protein